MRAAHALGRGVAMLTWGQFVRFVVGLLLLTLTLTLLVVTYKIAFGSGDAAAKQQLQAVGTDILLPALTAALGVIVAAGGIAAAARAWYNVHRKDSDPWLEIKLFEW
jgi:hypothetical protein